MKYYNFNYLRIILFCFPTFFPTLGNGAVSPSCHTTGQVSLATGRTNASADSLETIIDEPTLNMKPRSK